MSENMIYLIKGGIVTTQDTYHISLWKVGVREILSRRCGGTHKGKKFKQPKVFIKQYSDRTILEDSKKMKLLQKCFF